MTLWSIGLSFYMLISSYAISDEVANKLNEAARWFQKDNLSKGKTILEELSANKNLSIQEKASVNNRIAWFYDEVVGDYQFALRYSRIVLESSLPESDAAMIEAANRIKKIEHNATKYSKEDGIVEKAGISPVDRADAQEKIQELKLLLENSPEYPGRPIAYHFIAKHYLYLEEYYQSYKSASALLESRPGITYLLPTEELMTGAREKFYYHLVTSCAKYIIIITVLIVSVLLYLSRFWRWMSLRYLTALPITIAAWGFFLMAASWGLEFSIPHRALSYLPAPQFIQSRPFSPGSDVLSTIFFYGVLGIICSFLLTLATQYFRSYRIRIAVSCTVLLLIFTSIYSIFYLKHCYQKSAFEMADVGILSAFTSHTYLPEKDFEPYILTNPRKYPDLILRNSDDKILIDWVNKQYSIITGQPIEILNKRLE